MNYANLKIFDIVKVDNMSVSKSTGSIQGLH